MKNLAIIVLLALAGCSSYYAEKDHKECAAYGLNGAEYSQCRIALSNIREQRRSRAMANYYNTQAIIQANQPTKPIHCYTYGNSVSCY